MSEEPRAVVLLSGGIDSTTLLAIAQEQSFATYTISFWYGQRHVHEIEAARAIAERMRPLQVDLALTLFSEGDPVRISWVPKNPQLPTRSHITHCLVWVSFLSSCVIFIYCDLPIRLIADVRQTAPARAYPEGHATFD